jgi:acyl carrier protein
MLDPRLAAAIAENFGVNVTEITPESSAGDLPGWDSVGHITLILSIEEEFGIRFPADEILNLTSAARIQEALTKHHSSH